MTTPEIPDKLYFKIGEVAKLANLPTHVLRYWESEFPRIKPKRARSKQRLYRRQDVELILYIRELLHEQGYTIAGARKLLESGSTPPQPASSSKTPQLPATASHSQLSIIKEELRKLQEILDPSK